MYWEMTEDPREVRVFFSGSFFCFSLCRTCVCKVKKKERYKRRCKSQRRTSWQKSEDRKRSEFLGVLTFFFWLSCSFLFSQTAHVNEEVKPRVGRKIQKIQKQQTRNELLGFSFSFYFSAFLKKKFPTKYVRRTGIGDVSGADGQKARWEREVIRGQRVWGGGLMG